MFKVCLATIGVAFFGASASVGVPFYLGGDCMKKVLAGLLAVMMLLTVLPMSAVTVSAATSSGKTGECKWVLNGTKLTISGKGAMGNYDVENEKLAPWGTKVTTITIKEGVTTVGVGAFYLCTELKKVALPESVQAIGDLAFCGCVELTSITLPENLVYIGGGAFSLCGIAHITIPRSVDTIGAMAFYVSALEEIVLPAPTTAVFKFTHPANAISPTSVTAGRTISSKALT